MTGIRKYWIALIFIGLTAVAFAQNEGHQHPQQATENHDKPSSAETGPANAHPEDASHGCGHSMEVKEGEFNAGETAVHHIADANAIHVVGDIYIPLPCFLYAPSQGWTITTTAAFHPHHHGNGTVAKDGYVLVHGSVQRVQDPAFPKGEVPVSELLPRRLRRSLNP